MLMLNDPTADVYVDAATKGIPSGTPPVRLAEIARQGWNVLAGDCPLPLAVIRADILAANSAWMMEFVRLHGLLLAPHGKTTMAPSLHAQQLADGAWGITVATTQQLAVCVRAGARRVILANQPIGRSVDACFEALRNHPDLELYVLADSVAGVSLLAKGAARFTGCAALRVLIEIGVVGARTGCRDVQGAYAVAAAIAASPGLTLAGVEAYEGVLKDEAAVAVFVAQVVETTRMLDAAELFVGDIVLTAGGSSFFDLVAVGFQSIGISRPVLRVLRSGCYLTHDHFGYARRMASMLQARRLELPEGQLRPALEVWSYVQSRPDPDKVLLTMGKRDVGYDHGWPQPISWFRPSAMSMPAPIPSGCVITALNDQHAHMTISSDAPLEVGDMVSVGIAHPCTTFERWQVVMLVDKHFNVVGAVQTCF